MHVPLQEECEGPPTATIQWLTDTVDALHSQIPYKADTELAQKVFQRSLKPLPAQPAQPAAAPAAMPASEPAKQASTQVSVPCSQSVGSGHCTGARVTQQQERSPRLAVVLGPVLAFAVLTLSAVLLAVLVKKHRVKKRKLVVAADKQLAHQVHTLQLCSCTPCTCVHAHPALVFMRAVSPLVLLMRSIQRVSTARQIGARSTS
jgi:hypothetical protein